MIYDLQNCTWPSWHSQICFHTVTRSNGYKLSSSPVQLHSFSQRVVSDWNSLPTDIVSALDVTTLKTLLDGFWSNYCYIVINFGFIRLSFTPEPVIIIIQKLAGYNGI